MTKGLNHILNERRLASQLQGEGYSHTYFWADGPNRMYPDHAHSAETAHVILSGEMTLTINGESHLYRAGDRCDVPAGVPHSAVMGRLGCRYIVAERASAY